ncbi:MAG TPA: branched-chain amino acid ABC transporter permease [Geminicoccaceae bacterium]|jgi:branched-chain amino acid transport system permease protein|nr:branched-chain amino acid ABC transporter permease [Geminicoccaceae bacterium]
MTEAAYFVIDVLSLGSLYALMALGLVLVYGILKLVNFAYGELIMVAGYALYLLDGSPLPWLVMALVAILAAVLASVLTERIAFRPVREKSLTAMLITSFAVSTLLQNAALLLISPRARVVPLPDLFSQNFMIGGVLIQVRDLLAVAVSLAMLALFTLLLNRTVLGIALRAAADNFRMTRMLGVPANLVISVAFAISGLLAGVVALFWLGRTASVTPGIGLEPLIVAFVATVVGGLNSLQGAVVGGYVLALMTVGINTFLPQDLVDYRQAFTFGLVILILLFRPEGLIRGAR